MLSEQTGQKRPHTVCDSDHMKCSEQANLMRKKDYWLLRVQWDLEVEA